MLDNSVTPDNAPVKKGALPRDRCKDVSMLGILAAVALAAAPPAAAPPAKPQPSTRELFIDVGFSHWWGKTFGAPIGASTPALLVGMRPGVRYLEVRLHYTVSLYGLELPTNGESSRVGFANVDVVLEHELRVAGERMMILGGVSGGLVHTSQGVGPSVGSVLGVRYLIDVSPRWSLGPFFDLRWQLYKLPGSDEPFYEVTDGQLVTGHSDAQAQIGVAFGYR
jgi:hypothetical protein